MPGAGSVSDSLVKHGCTVPEGIFVYHFQRRALFVPDSQWNLYWIARYRVT